MRFSIFFYILVSFTTGNLFSQSLFFEKTFDIFNGIETAKSVKEFGDSSIFIVGNSTNSGAQFSDISLSRLDKYGNLKWTRYYGDTLDDFGLYMNKVRNGNLIIVGETYSAVTGTDAIIIETDTSGQIIWKKIIASPKVESLKYIEQTADKGFVATGFQSDTSGSNNIYVVKTDSLGNIEWERSIGGADNEYADAVHELPEGAFLVTGDTRSKGLGGYDVEVVKLDKKGNTIWDKTYGDQFNNGCQGILITSKNRYLSFGETEIYSLSRFDFYCELIDTSGKSLWRKVWGGAQADALFSAVEDSDGSFVFTGYSNSYNGNKPLDLVVLKTDSLANMQWLTTYGFQGIDIGYSIEHSIAGGYLIAGVATNADNDYFVLHVNDTGVVNSVHQSNPSEIGFQLFPNPTPGKFTVALTNENNVKTTTRIKDITGRLIDSFVFDGNRFEYSTNQLPKALYIVEIESVNNPIYSCKLVIY